MTLTPTVLLLDARSPEGWFATIADLHADHIRHGLLPLLGRPFLARLYAEMAVVDSAGVWAAVEHDEVVGFLAGTFDDRVTYREILRRAAWPLARLALRQIAPLLRVVYSTVAYARRRGVQAPDKERQGAELLAIAVDERQRRTSAGTQLMESFEQALVARSIQAYSVTTNAEEVASNGFYRARGFVLMGTMPHHSLTLNIYEKTLS